MATKTNPSTTNKETETILDIKNNEGEKESNTEKAPEVPVEKEKDEDQKPKEKDEDQKPKQEDEQPRKPSDSQHHSYGSDTGSELRCREGNAGGLIREDIQDNADNSSRDSKDYNLDDNIVEESEQSSKNTEEEEMSKSASMIFLRDFIY